MQRRTGRKMAITLALIWLFAVQLTAATRVAREAPDAVLSPPPFVVHPGTPALVQRFEIPSGQLKDRWIRGFQFQSCDPRLVQSVNLYVDNCLPKGDLCVRI